MADLREKLSARKVIRRAAIQQIWREVRGYGANVELAASDKEWAFMEALVDYGMER